MKTKASNAVPIVLVLDDSKEICNALRRDLRALDSVCVTATNIKEAKAWLENPNVHIDIALVDLYIDEEDGLCALNYISSKYPDIYRVIMSGKMPLSRMDMIQTYKLAHAILPKPWSRTLLAKVLSNKSVA